MGKEKRMLLGKGTKRCFKECGFFLLLLVLSFIPVLIGNLLIYFEPSSFDQVLFHWRMPLTDDAFKASFTPFFRAVPLAFLAAAVLYGVTLVPVSFIRRRRKSLCFSLIFSLTIIVFALLFKEIKLWDTLRATVFSKPSQFYETYYKDPAKLFFSFPEKKRDMIFIVMESMENSYAMPSLFGENLLPKLSALSKENVSFSGYLEFDGTQWTIASHVSMLCGIPMKMSVFADESPLGVVTDNGSEKLIQYTSILKNAYCLTDLLNNKGYIVSYMRGADIHFAGMDSFLKNHGFSRMVGWNKHDGNFLPKEDSGHYFGLRDKLLYERAKKEILFLRRQDKPYFFMLLTLDTHFPEGFLDPSCPPGSSGKEFSAVVSCSDKMLSDFLSWMGKEGILEDTTVFIVGDHLTMRNTVYEKILQNPQREIVNVVINPAFLPFSLEHSFSAMDLAPTLLESMGIIPEDHAFGLGRSLFSVEKTLPEQIPLEEMKQELRKRSQVYKGFIED